MDTDGNDDDEGPSPPMHKGARVRLKQSRADDWREPIRGFAKTGRLATVLDAPTQASPARHHRIEFDTARKGEKARQIDVIADNIEPAPT